MALPQVSTAQAFVEIYPFEGGSYTISGQQANLLGLSVTNGVVGITPGKFSMQIAPGGPNGVNGSPLWTEIVTPMSLVVIGLSRAGRQNIVMVGVVLSAVETTTWVSGRGAQRAVQIDGQDFGYIFNSQLFYLQTYLLMSNLAGLPSPAIVDQFGAGLLEGAPDKVAAAWFDIVMAGSKGVVSGLNFAYQTSRLSFSSLMSTFFEAYPGSTYIPYSTNFLSSDGSWASKFDSILPAPFYETFVTTSPINYYNTGGVAGGMNGTTISMAALPKAPPVTPVLIGRVNPFPSLYYDINSKDPSHMSLDMTRWDVLPVSYPDNSGFINSQIALDVGEVRNFFVINPIGISNNFGGSNSQTTPFMFQHAAFFIPSSIHRYGLRPLIAELEWFNDPTGGQAQQVASSNGGYQAYEDLVTALALKQVSFFTPLGLMRRAVVTTEMRPDIMPGTRYRYAPHKDGVTWEFYVETVTHTYNFGGICTTTLGLSRGLPKSTYDNPQVMLDIHLGNAMLQNGNYVSGLPSGVTGSLTTVNAESIGAGVLGQLAGLFNMPQGQ